MGRFSHFSSLRKLISLGTTFYASATPPAFMTARLSPPIPQPTCFSNTRSRPIRARDTTILPAQLFCSIAGAYTGLSLNRYRPDKTLLQPHDVIDSYPTAPLFSNRYIHKWTHAFP